MGVWSARQSLDSTRPVKLSMPPHLHPTDFDVSPLPFLFTLHPLRDDSSKSVGARFSPPNHCSAALISFPFPLFSPESLSNPKCTCSISTPVPFLSPTMCASPTAPHPSHFCNFSGATSSIASGPSPLFGQLHSPDSSHTLSSEAF